MLRTLRPGFGLRGWVVSTNRTIRASAGITAVRVRAPHAGARFAAVCSVAGAAALSRRRSAKLTKRAISQPPVLTGSAANGSCRAGLPQKRRKATRGARPIGRASVSGLYTKGRYPTT